MELQEIKEYLRIDGSEEDTSLSSFLKGAQFFLKNAGVPNDVSSQQELYDISVKMLVSHWYENREPLGKADQLAFSLGSIITQLKYCIPVIEEEPTNV